MNNIIGYLGLISLCFMQIGCDINSSKIESISISFPMGGNDLRVFKNGDTFLYYDSRIKHSIIKKGIFNTEQLYKKIEPYLHPNTPSENWPVPSAQTGMVQIRFINKSEENYLIFNPQIWTSELFKKAKKNIISEYPPR